VERGPVLSEVDALLRSDDDLPVVVLLIPLPEPELDPVLVP